LKQTFLERMAQQVLIGDGAMGTYLYQLGIPVGLSYEELNVTKPELIQRVHQEYIAAGANVIQTNTYSAQREKLAKFGLDDQVAEINRAAVRLAKLAATDDVYVLGTVGSLTGGYKRSFLSSTDLERNYREQMEWLLEEGVEGLILETFYHLEELLLTLRIAKELGEFPVICQFAIEEVGRLNDGTPLEQAFRVLLDQGADVVGLNCRSGPSNMIRSLEACSKPFPGILSAFPNAGLPAYIDGEYVYASLPEYFGRSAKEFVGLGVRLIGGCCGTTPEHIRNVAAAIAEMQVSSPQCLVDPAQDTRHAGGSQEHNGIIQVLDRHDESSRNPSQSDGGHLEWTLPELAAMRKTVIVELDPPKSLSTAKYMEGAYALKEAGADALTMADNSLAVTRMSNMALAVMVKEQVGIRPVVHIACRDRNLIGQQSHLMGLHALGIDHVLAITGDPSRFGDFPGASSVYDLSSFDLLEMIRMMNQGYLYSGKPLKEQSNFKVAAAFNPNVRFLDKAIKRLERKIASGAHYIMTQPVYDHHLIEQIYDATRHLDVPVFLGIMPLISKRNAEFLHYEVPGITLTEDVLRRMAKFEGEDARKQGLEIAMELLETAMKFFNGVYLMTPLLRYEMTVELTRFVRQKQKISKHTVM
jgi:methionine synthase I (cobalamin-dependent)/5,10-methylenetetrahydrofolate reductase